MWNSSFKIWLCQIFLSNIGKMEKGKAISVVLGEISISFFIWFFKWNIIKTLNPQNMPSQKLMEIDLIKQGLSFNIYSLFVNI